MVQKSSNDQKYRPKMHKRNSLKILQNLPKINTVTSFMIDTHFPGTKM